MSKVKPSTAIDTNYFLGYESNRCVDSCHFSYLHILLHCWRTTARCALKFPRGQIKLLELNWLGWKGLVRVLDKTLESGWNLIVLYWLSHVSHQPSLFPARCHTQLVFYGCFPFHFSTFSFVSAIPKQNLFFLGGVSYHHFGERICLSIETMGMFEWNTLIRGGFKINRCLRMWWRSRERVQSAPGTMTLWQGHDFNIQRLKLALQHVAHSPQRLLARSDR